MKNRSVTQSYLLCTLKERNRLASYSAEKGMCLVAGSVLELLLDGVLAFDGKRLTAAAPLPPEKDYLAPVYGFVGEKQPVKPEKVIENFSLQFTNRNLDALLEHVGASLEAAGCARREQGGLLGGKTVYVPEPAALDAAVQEIRAELWRTRADRGHRRPHAAAGPQRRPREIFLRLREKGPEKAAEGAGK